jgi:hypothetical protein
MTPRSKIQRVPRPAGKDRRSHKRLDANARGIRALPCRYRACGVVFMPRRKGQVYHTPACRRADCLNRKYIPRGEAVALAELILWYDEKFARQLSVDYNQERAAWSAIIEQAKLVKS